MKNKIKNLLAFALVAMLGFGSVLPVLAQDTASATDYTGPASSEASAIFGDTNLDGKVNIKDATDIQKFVAKIIGIVGISQVLADVNEDKKVNIKDTSEIQKWLAQLSSIDKIGKPLEQDSTTSPSTEPVSTETPLTTEAKPTPSTSASSVASSTSAETTAQTDPEEIATTATAPATSASGDEQTPTEPTESSVATDPTEPTEEPKPTEAPSTPATDNPPMPTEAPSTTPEEEEMPQDHYRSAVMKKFAEDGYNPYEEGMLYELIYCYYGENTQRAAAAPEFVLVWASIGAVADEAFEYTIGDYVLKCSGHCYPYNLGYYIYIPSTDNLMTIEDAYRQNLKGLRTVFEQSPVFRPIRIDYRILEETRINYYGSEKTELYLLRHSSDEEAVTSKFTDGYFDTPELNLPKDEKGFYYDKIYLVSFNVVGGGNASQWLYKITLEDGILTAYYSINQPANQTPDMNYQYVLIELDASLSESIYKLEFVREVYTTGGGYDYY